MSTKESRHGQDAEETPSMWELGNDAMRYLSRLPTRSLDDFIFQILCCCERELRSGKRDRRPKDENEVMRLVIQDAVMKIAPRAPYSTIEDATDSALVRVLTQQKFLKKVTIGRAVPPPDGWPDWLQEICESLRRLADAGRIDRRIDGWAPRIAQADADAQSLDTTACGVSLRRIAMILEDSDDKRVCGRLDRWCKCRHPKPEPIGYDPKHSQCELYAPAPIVEWIEQYDGDIPCGKADLLKRLVDIAGDLTDIKPSGFIPFKLNWDNLDAEEFERLIFTLISNEMEYENPEWLTKTKATDAGRDLSVQRRLIDSLTGTSVKRVIIQCRNRPSQSIRPADVATLKQQIKIWEPPKVDTLIIATTGRFTSDAVKLIEQNNESDVRLQIEMWPDSHLERLLAIRPGIIADFNLR